MAAFVDLKERMNMTFLTLDYCGKEEIYGGKNFATGTIACDVLNIPEETVHQIVLLTDPMMRFVDALYDNRVDLLLMEQSRKNVFLVISLLKTVAPFSYQDFAWLDQKLSDIFSAEAMRKASRQMHKSGGLGELFVRALSLVAQLGFGIQEYQRALIPLVESLDNEDLTRNAEGYAKQFAQFFVPEEYGEDKWMAFANVSVQYRSGENGLVRRMHYASFPSMFRSDLFEALTVGNAPKRCPVCGRFFLTTNARRTKYCNGLAPGGPEKRTCVQVAARMGREYRELADNNPHKIKRKQAIDAIDQRVHRGTMAIELAEIMKTLARNKCDRALSDAKYANTRYNAEMVLDFLEEDARRILGK